MLVLVIIGGAMNMAMDRQEQQQKGNQDTAAKGGNTAKRWLLFQRLHQRASCDVDQKARRQGV